MDPAIVIGFSILSVVSTSLVIAAYFHASALRERKRGDAWQTSCSEREQRIRDLGEANVACQAIIDGLENQLNDIRRICASPEHAPDVAF